MVKKEEREVERGGGRRDGDEEERDGEGRDGEGIGEKFGEGKKEEGW